MKIINGFHLKNVRGDILGGITAAVVALPLALAFGNAALGPGGAIYGPVSYTHLTLPTIYSV